MFQSSDKSVGKATTLEKFIPESKRKKKVSASKL